MIVITQVNELMYLRDSLKKAIDSYVTSQLRVYLSKCSNETLNGLGEMYASGGEFTENIDKASGNGTAAFVAKAIEYYCK